jgi:hypothetical protein
MKSPMLKLLGLVVVLVGGGEAIARYALGVVPAPLAPDAELVESIAKFAEFDPVLGVRYRPNVDVLVDAPSGDFSILFKTNEIGLRDRPMGTHLRQELKFLFLGDEYVEGWGTDIDETPVVIAQRLVNEKTELQPPVRFVIGGKSGYGAAQNLLIGRQLIDAMPIRGIVFVYTALMPHADRRFLDQATLSDGLATGVDPAVAPAAVSLPHAGDRPRAADNPFRALAPKSALARWLAERWAAYAMMRAHPPGDAARDRLAGLRASGAALDATLEPSLRHVKAIAGVAREHDIPFMLVHLPLAPQIAADEWTAGRALFGVPAEAPSTVDSAPLAAFCKAENLRCLSLHAFLQDAAAAPDSLPLHHRSEFGLTVDGSRLLGTWLANTVFDWMGELKLR